MQVAKWVGWTMWVRDIIVWDDASYDLSRASHKMEGIGIVVF